MAQEEQAGNAARAQAETLPHYRLIRLEWNNRHDYCNHAVTGGHRKDRGIT